MFMTRTPDRTPEQNACMPEWMFLGHLQFHVASWRYARLYAFGHSASLKGTVIAEDRRASVMQAAIAFARFCLQLCAITYRQHAAPVRDEPLILQRVRNLGHSGSLHAKQHRQIFLREREGIRPDIVSSGQQPAATTLLDMMKAIAGRDLHQLNQGVSRALVDEVVQGAVSF